MESGSAVKAGDLTLGGLCLGAALADAHARGAQAVILGCTELPVAAQHLHAQAPLQLIDSTLELARQAVKHALYLGWNRAPWLAQQAAASTATTAATDTATGASALKSGAAGPITRCPQPAGQRDARDAEGAARLSKRFAL